MLLSPSDPHDVTIDRMKSLHLPLEPFPVHIGSFTTNVTLKRPFHNRRPIKITFSSDTILLFQLGRDVGGNRGMDDAFPCSKLGSQIRPVTFNVKRLPPTE